jgi:ABC-2 type transport system ATP-binding protein
MSLLQVENVSKRYKGGVLANDGISLTVNGGRVFGLIGPNGAGKTTLVSQILGISKPSSGRIVIEGVDILKDPTFARQSCSYQPQTQVPINGVTPLQAIELVGRLRHGDAETVRHRTRELIQSLELEPWATVGGHKLSGGIRRLTAFCMAAVVPGKLVILDEPTNDVDPLRRRLLWREVRKLAARGSTVILVTHNILAAERSVDELAIIDQGRVVSHGTAASFKENDAGWLRIELTLETASHGMKWPRSILRPVVLGNRLYGMVKAKNIEQTVIWAKDSVESEMIEEFSIGPSTLEDAYIRLIGRQDALEENNMESSNVLSTSMA